MKTAVTMISVGGRFNEGKIDVHGFIEFCGRIGVDGVDLLEYYWKDKPREMKAIPGWLADNNLVLSAFAIGNNFAVSNPRKMQEQVDYVKKGIDTAAVLGAKTLRIFGGHLSPDGINNREEGMEAIVYGISRCIDHAKANRVVLALENHGDLPGRSDQVLRILNQFQSDYLKATIDIANFIANNMNAKEDPVSATKALVGRAAHCHVKDFADNPAATGKVKACVLGEGKTPIRECLQVLKNGGYQGFLSLEYEGHENEGVAIEDALGTEQSIRNLKKILQEVV
ncbi:MAG: sugar phosphate isomerase/epimerase [Kiritimatiellaeota bacterium]|nr:sugar phosphate isomerase/epimerase [Kiritimatiellota bacterium]